MKKKSKYLIGLLSLVVLLFITTSSASEDLFYYYRAYTPVFMDRSDLDNSVSYVSEVRELQQPGKIYYRKPYIFINEKYKGIHIIDNSDPKNLVNKGFIKAPGCIDMAVKNNILYLDNSVDLVAFNLDTKIVTERIKDVFPEPQAPDGADYYTHNRPDGMVIVSWEKTKK